MFKRYVEYLRDNPEGYWFKAKIFGWGWTPVRWQGWVTLAIFLGLIFLNAFRLDMFSNPDEETPISFIVQTIGLIFILLVICYRTGEKPHWQWGLPKKETEK